MKRFAALTLALVITLLSLTGCSNLLNAMLDGDSGEQVYPVKPSDIEGLLEDIPDSDPGLIVEPYTEPPETTTAATTTTITSTTTTTTTTTTATTTATAPTTVATTASPKISESGEYTKKDDVALYIHTFGHLPSNFITKKEAQALGWSGGSLEPYAPGKSIGGDNFGNREGLLPSKKGRKYTECDIDTKGKKSRGAKRIVFSNDGLIYYTDDHYESFELLYGNP